MKLILCLGSRMAHAFVEMSEHHRRYLFFDYVGSRRIAFPSEQRSSHLGRNSRTVIGVISLGRATHRRLRHFDMLHGQPF